MKKIITAVSACAIAATAVPYRVYAEETAKETQKKVKIMCIGDSITDGYVPEYEGSYRKFIYKELTKKGYDIDMVGAKGEGYTPTYKDENTGESFEFDNGNTGYSGYAISAYPGRNGILETLKETNCLAETKPDIVTLQIGTNNILDNHDMDENLKDLETLIDYILENTPETTAVFVTTIPELDPNRPEVYDWFGNYRHSADWQTQYSDEEALEKISKKLDDYNANLSLAVIHKSLELGGAGQEDEFFPEPTRLYNAYVSQAITDVKTQLFDGVHPNNEGYKAMGEYWADVLDKYLQGNIPQVPDIVTTTTSATTTTTAETPEKEPLKVSDLVTFSRYLLGDKSHGTEAKQLKRYDLDGDGVLDVYDLVNMRKTLIS